MRPLRGSAGLTWDSPRGFPNGETLDGPAIRNANRGDSHESIRRKPQIVHNVRAIRANRLKPAMVCSPDPSFAQIKRFA